MSTLPPFPVDDATLGMLEAAMDPWNHGHPEATQSNLWPYLQMLSQMAGSDVDAFEEDDDDGIAVFKGPLYTDHSVIEALIGEVRRLRSITGHVEGARL